MAKHFRFPFSYDDALWIFDTERLSVRLYATPEDMPPEDAFEFHEDIEAVHSGTVDWFTAWVAVHDKRTGAVLGYDTLGGCAYKTARSFAEGANRSGYFRDMVREACREARGAMRTMPKLREVA